MAVSLPALCVIGRCGCARCCPCCCGGSTTSADPPSTGTATSYFDVSSPSWKCRANPSASLSTTYCGQHTMVNNLAAKLLHAGRIFPWHGQQIH